MGYSLGVDLGTTFVAAATASSGRVKMFTLGDRSVVTPAAVYLREDNALVTGEAAALRAVSNPERVSREIKRRLGNPTPIVLGGQPFTVTVLLSVLLQDVIQKVIETEGDPPERIVLTHPANWGPFRRALFEEVPLYAGLDKPLTVTEPEAAAAHYAASRQLADGDTVAVYDLGGGTFDATILRARRGGVEILGTPEGIEKLGGVDFDETILSYVDYAADGALTELDMRDPQSAVALARLRQDCVLAKEALSVDTEALVPVFLPDRHFDVRITRSGFEDLVRASVESTIGALSRTLQSAQVKPADLKAVLLVGGSSRIPLIARMVAAELGRPTVVDTHPKYAVALGAATLAAQAPMPVTGTVFTAAYQESIAAATPALVSTASTAPTTSPAPPPAPTTAHTPSPPPPTPAIPAASAAPSEPAPPPIRRGRRPWLLVTTALVIAGATAAFVLLKPLIVGASTVAPRLMLSTCQVNIGDIYTATASGFVPGENVRFSWIGPTNGVMGAFPADSGGNRSHGGILERDPPGTYAIIATGLASGRTTSAGLVVTDTEAARLMLSTCQTRIGDTYTATPSGFLPGEAIRLSWAGPTSGVTGTFPADPTGMTSQDKTVDKEVPGTYTITATGLTSGRTATAGLEVLRAGS